MGLRAALIPTFRPCAFAKFCPVFSRTLVGKSVRTSERTFQELKSQNALDAFRTTSAYIVEALIRSALLTLVARRRLYNPVRARAPPELVPPTRGRCGR